MGERRVRLGGLCCWVQLSSQLIIISVILIKLAVNKGTFYSVVVFWNVLSSAGQYSTVL